FRSDLGFKMRYQIMRVLQAHGFVEFEVLFHMEWTAEVLDTDIMNAEVVAGGHAANPVEDVLFRRLPRDRVNDYVAIGEHLVDGIRDFRNDLTGALEGHVA